MQVVRACVSIAAVVGCSVCAEGDPSITRWVIRVAVSEHRVAADGVARAVIDEHAVAPIVLTRRAAVSDHVARARRRAADQIVVADDPNAVRVIAEHSRAVRTNAYEVALDRVAFRAEEDPDACAVSGDDVARGRRRAADDVLPTRAGGNGHAAPNITERQRAGDVSADEVALDDIAAGWRTIAQHANAVIEIAGDEVTRARRCAADEVVLTVVNLKAYGAVGDRRRARRVRADVIALNDVAGARRTAAVFDQDAVVDVAGDDVARGGVGAADLVAVSALKIDARAVAVGCRARCVRADEVAFDVSIRGDALVQSNAVNSEAVDD